MSGHQRLDDLGVRVEGAELQVVGGGCGQRGLRDEADDLGVEDLHPEARGLQADQLESSVRRGDHGVEEVHRDLDAAALGHREADRPDADQASRALTHPPRHLLGGALVAAAQIDVEGDQRWPRPDRGGPGPADVVGAQVGEPPALGHVGPEALVLAAAHLGEADPVGPGGCPLVEVDGQREGFGQLAGDAAGQLHAIVHGHPADGDEGDHVHSPHPGVAASLLIHVDELDGLGGPGQGGGPDRRGRADEGGVETVVVRVRLAVEQGGAGDRRHRCHDGVHHLDPAALAEVGHHQHQRLARRSGSAHRRDRTVRRAIRRPAGSPPG